MFDAFSPISNADVKLEVQLQVRAKVNRFLIASAGDKLELKSESLAR